MEIDVISKQEVEQIALNTVCDYIKPEEWCEKGSIRQDIKDLTGNIDRHAESLHNMFEAINAVSRMAGHHKEWIDKLEKRIKVLEESCQLKKK
jgi:hypothetical protein